MKKLGKNMDDIISTNMKIASFIGDASNALGVLYIH